MSWQLLSLYMSCHIENWRGQFDRAIELASAGAAIAREHNLSPRSCGIRMPWGSLGRAKATMTGSTLLTGLTLAEQDRR